jgi:alpha-L-arabinofuranosidase
MKTLQPAIAEMTSITIQADKPGAKINPAMWGIFFEDINFGADGGLYAELVKNRAFEFPDPLMGWIRIGPSLARGEISIRDDGPFDPANPHHVRILSEGAAPFGISNEGFRGMGVRRGEAYHFSAQIRGVSGSPVLLVQLYGADGSLLDSVPLGGFSSNWKKCTATLHPNDTDAKARLALVVEAKGAVDLDWVSLFPERTWKNRPGGLRADMVGMLADLRPGFLRFPGGCIVEGSVLEWRYQWKSTIGPIEDRKLLINRWNYEFLHRPTPDYFQSFGLGFFEFFQLCEDIGAEPLPILNCGMACQFNSGELVPLDGLDPYIQDALDLIEFANGSVSSPWGATRAALGHPVPFNMKMLGVGNEQWGPQYIERYARFAKILKAQHPEISLVSDAGPSPADDRFHYLWPKLRELKADIVDEHCYANPIWFLANSHRYDSYDRQGPKVFMGEYGAQSVAIVSPKNRNNLECALAEAAFMTGLERNADVVRMASYAPLFANMDAWQWTPDLIWCDSLRACGTPSYYVQQLFSQNRGDVVLPVKLEGAEIPAPATGCIGLGTHLTAAEYKEIRVTRDSETLFSSDFQNGAPGWSGASGQWSIKEDAYQQTALDAPAWVFAGDDSWRDYTVSLKARKVAGVEGFLVVIRRNGPENYVVWNLGANRNTCHALIAHLGQQDQVIAQAPGSIEPGRWYAVRIELKKTALNCYLDDRLVQHAEVPVPQPQRLYACASRDDRSGEIILKAVNALSEPAETRIELRGIRSGTPARAIVLRGSNPADENSLDAPRNVFPREQPVPLPNAAFDYSFPPYSVTVLRVPAETGVAHAASTMKRSGR